MTRSPDRDHCGVPVDVTTGVELDVTSAFDHCHLLSVVVVASGGRDAREPVDLLGAQTHLVSRDVLLETRDALGARDRHDVLTLGEHPREGDLGGGGPDLGGDRGDLLDRAQVVLEVIADEPWVGLSRVVLGEVLD